MGEGGVLKSMQEELLDGLILELRRGTITLGVLSQLKAPSYGYSLVASLQEKGLNVDASTVYPLLRRLEKQGILESEWNTDGAKPRKYYQLSEEGKEIYLRLCENWFEMNVILENLVREAGEF